MNTVKSSIELIGTTAIARKFGYRPSAVQKWRDESRLPRSDLAGLTKYAEAIAELSRGTEKPVTVDALLADTRAAWEAKPAGKPGVKKAPKLRPKRAEARAS